MDDSNSKNTLDKFNKKTMIIIASCLCVLAVGLIISLIVVRINSQNEEETITNSERETDDWVELDTEITRGLVDARSQINAIDEKDSSYASKISELYDPLIKMAVDNARLDYMITMVVEKSTILESKGYKREALEALASQDYSSLSGPDRYRMYNRMVKLADELGEVETANQYRELQKAVESEYWADYNATEEAVKRYQENPKLLFGDDYGEPDTGQEAEE